LSFSQTSLCFLRLMRTCPNLLEGLPAGLKRVATKGLLDCNCHAMQHRLLLPISAIVVALHESENTAAAGAEPALHDAARALHDEVLRGVASPFAAPQDAASQGTVPASGALAQQSAAPAAQGSAVQRFAHPPCPLQCPHPRRAESFSSALRRSRSGAGWDSFGHSLRLECILWGIDHMSVHIFALHTLNRDVHDRKPSAPCKLQAGQRQ